MNPVIGWGLAVLAVAVGYAGYGWPGVALGVSAVVFWLLLQFSRALRVMRLAAARPLGDIDSAVMLQSRLQPGMLMMQIIKLTHSLGRKVGDDPEAWCWTDAGGDSVRVEMRDGRCARVTLERAAAGEPPPP